MSIYWAPADDDPPHARSEGSRELVRDLAALIYERRIPWEAAALRTLVRRIWMSGRGRTVTVVGSDNGPD